MDDKVYILTRTRNRPNYFKVCRQSIASQSYENIVHIVSYDDKNDLSYLKEYTDIKKFFIDEKKIEEKKDIPNPRTGPRSIYNLYFNEMHKYIEDGWVLILDDDDSLIHDDVISILMNKVSYETDMVIHQMEYLNKRRLPSASSLYKKPRLGQIGSPCVFCHSSIFKKIKWDGWKCADYRFISELWRLTQRKIWINYPLIKIGSTNGNLGNKKDVSENRIKILTNKIVPKQKQGVQTKRERKIASHKKKKYVKHLYLIPTYNRYDNLINQIKKIHDMYLYDPHDYHIIVCDDGSTDIRYSNIEKEPNLTYIKNEINLGKKRYWQTINKGLYSASKYSFDFLIQMDDDFIISNKLPYYLNNIKYKNKLGAIKLHKDQRREVWQKNKWVDGGAAYTEKFIKTIGYTIDVIPETRWRFDKNLSSGVWQQITEKLLKHRFDIIMPRFSLFHHNDNNISRMNTHRNKINYNLETENFQENSVAIIMCTWNRINKFQKTLDCLVKQSNLNFTFFVWNNNLEYSNELEEIAKQYIKLDTHIYNSDSNIGGFGRFYMAKKIASLYDKVIFIDDDQVFEQNTIKKFLQYYEPKTIKSWWAWKIRNRYFDRVRCKHNENADYCGTGGMICDSSIFLDETLYDCPKEYWFIEDLWLSFFAKNKHKWNLKGINVPIKIEQDGKDQYLKKGNKKNDFLFLLKKKNWNDES